MRRASLSRERARRPPRGDRCWTPTPARPFCLPCSCHNGCPRHRASPSPTPSCSSTKRSTGHGPGAGFGYYTKPPLIAWIVGATTSLCGDTPFCVRLPSPLMHLLTSLVIYALAAKLHSRRIAFWAALVHAIMPGTSISATLMSTDVPLVLFWAIAPAGDRPSCRAAVARRGRRARRGDRPWPQRQIRDDLPSRSATRSTRRCSPRARATLRHPGTWAALAIALLLIAPNLIWNAQHQFATFEHTRENADWSGRFPNILGLLAFLGTQIAITGPVPFAAFVLAAIGRMPGLDGEPQRFLLAMSLPVFAADLRAGADLARPTATGRRPGFRPPRVLAAAVMVVLGWRRGMIFTLCPFGWSCGRHLLRRLARRG